MFFIKFVAASQVLVQESLTDNEKKRLEYMDPGDRNSYEFLKGFTQESLKVSSEQEEQPLVSNFIDTVKSFSETAHFIDTPIKTVMVNYERDKLNFDVPEK